MTPQQHNISPSAQPDNNWLTGNAATKGKPAPLVHTSNLTENIFPAIGYLGGVLHAMDRMLDYAMQSMWRPPMSMRPSAMVKFGLPAMTQPFFQPGVDITSDDATYTISLEVPGVEEKDLQLEISEAGTLTIRGVKHDERIKDNKDVHYAECCYGAFTRTLSLPGDVDDKRIEARVRNGILTVVCPRQENAVVRSRPIAINQSAGNTAHKNGNRTEREENQQAQREQTQRESRRAA